jgi:hypothetical protein
MLLTKRYCKSNLPSSSIKVSSQDAIALGNKNQDSKAEVPPLSLIPDEDEMEQSDAAKKGTFKLRLDPTDVNSQKYFIHNGLR